MPIAAGKQRALLAILLLDANRSVGRDQIVDALWGEGVPESAQKMVQIQVSQLRKALPEPRLHTRPPGYLLEVRDDELDLARFERSVADARRALAQGQAQEARELLGSALALWRGRALAEFSEPFARHEGARLEELRVAALEWRIEADFALGHHRDVVSELEALIAQYPLREHLRAQHMLALYRSGRHAEALAGYQTFRRTLTDDLGIEPSASLRELERLMLRQDATLDLPVAAQARTAASAPSGRHETARAGPGSKIGHARSGDVRIAYQVVGDGPLDLVLVHGWVCTFQAGWEHPNLAGFYRRLASLGRLILFDKRGTGLSDRVSPERLPDLETRMDDVRAVMDAVGSERAVVLGISEGGAMSALFAATHPERTLALVLMGTFARMLRAPDYPIGVSDDDFRTRLAVIEEDDWASAVTREWLERAAPGLLDDPAAVRWYTSYVLRGASPGASRAIRLMNAEIDIRDVLPAISVPTLVLYRSDEYYREGARFMGEHIPGARVAEFAGSDHLPWEGDWVSLLDETERFLAGVRDDIEPDRVLATLLFTDIAGSTAGNRAARAPPPARARAGRALSRPRGRRRRRRAPRNLRRPGPGRPLRLRHRRFRPRPRHRGARRCPYRRDRALGSGRTRNRRPCRRTHRRGRQPRGGTRVEHRQGHRRGLGHRLRGARRAGGAGSARHLAGVRGRAVTATHVDGHRGERARRARAKGR